MKSLFISSIAGMGRSKSPIPSRKAYFWDVSFTSVIFPPVIRLTPFCHQALFGSCRVPSAPKSRVGGEYCAACSNQLGTAVRDDSVYGFTPGVPLYMDTTDGGITATKPTGSGDTVRTVGYAVHADMIFFNPSSDYVTLA